MPRIALALCSATCLLAAESIPPARFVVTDHQLHPDPGAITATVGPGKAMVDMSFEPMVWRRMYHVEEAATGRLRCSNLDHYDSYAAPFWTGARVRVLRASGGRIDQVFAGTVKRYVRSHWSGISGAMLPADTTTVEHAIEGWAKHGLTWWFSVRAIDKAGRVSPRSQAVKLVDPDIPDRARPAEPRWTAPPRADATVPGAAPAAPTGFTASIDPATGLIRMAWQPAAGDVAGYLVDRTFTDPATHEGNFLELDAADGGDRFASRPGDLVFLTRTATSFSRDDFSPRLYGTDDARPPEYQPVIANNRDRHAPWQLVPHPGRLPEDIPDAGNTCVRIQGSAGEWTGIRNYNNSGTKQNWYTVLDPAETWVVEAVVRQEGLASGTLRFRHDGPKGGECEPITWNIDQTWKRVRGEFTVKTRQVDDVVGMTVLEFEGAGTVWLDNYRVYEKSGGLTRYQPRDAAAVRESGLAAIRTHDTIKTHGYLLDDLLGHPLMGLTSGREVNTRANMAGLLREFRDMGVSPWMQIEFTMDEAEWDGLVEYLAAPYDPAQDSPKTKPWAARRVAHGQLKPYTEVFPRILLEFGNETWNWIMPFCMAGATMPDAADPARIYSPPESYGMLQEYVIRRMKASKWWTPQMQAKTEFVLGGWIANDYGYLAAKMSPSSKHVLIADYNGGWDAGEGPSSDFDGALRKTLMYPGQMSRPNAIRLRGINDTFNAGNQRQVAIGTYEAGPGYNLNGLNGVSMTPEMVEFESRVMKSQVGGAATLDCFMNLAEQGAQLQNFFCFGRNRHYWTSHADVRNGGQAYPAWLALSIYNRHATGAQLKVLTAGVAVTSAQAVGRRAASDALPEAAVYATRSGDRLAVMAISRRLDGPMPMTLALPLVAAKSVTLHAMTGDPRANNLDSEQVTVVTTSLPATTAGREFALDATRGAPHGLPAAGVLVYVFEGCVFANDGPTAFATTAPGQAAATDRLPIRFRLGLNRPATVTTADIALSGRAEPLSCAVSPISGAYGMEYEVLIDQVMGDGDVRVGLKDGFAIDGRRVAGTAGAADLRLPAGTLFPVLAWDFHTVGQENYTGGPVACTKRMPIVGVSSLSASRPEMLGDNKYYNADGAGTWGGPLNGDIEWSYIFPVTPVAGRTVDIKRVEVGFWASLDKPEDAVHPELRIQTKAGKVIATVPFVADRPIRTKDYIGDIGIRAVADLSSIPALQPLAEELEFRITFRGTTASHAVFGIGKLGAQQDDIAVMGRVRSR
ncbi:MAG: hypothetical protein J0M02_06075 [Planctomycetes bacterium]|nr:hypothetical protein [Planctomycetota bacterium]